MKRRDLFKAGFSTAALGIISSTSLPTIANINSKGIRAQYPWLEHETYLNGAGMMPLSIVATEALQKYINVQHLGYHGPDEEFRQEVYKNAGKMFAKLINAKPTEITEISCTKQGEQIVIDSLPALKSGGNIVTNDLIFPGSLHNLVGLKKSGMDVRIVKSKNYKVSAADMEAAMDDKTALVSVALISNINGHKEQMEAISSAAHSHGALVYADIIQAAGIVPIDVQAMGIDVAACSCYKWLHGVHGSAFLYVKQEHQGNALPNHLYPGHSNHNYSPWVDKVDPRFDEYSWRSPKSAHRYQAGHFNYMGFCAAYEGLKYIDKVGVENMLNHSISLNNYLYERMDKDKYLCITPDRTSSPIITFQNLTNIDVKGKLNKAKIRANTFKTRLRISPTHFNNTSDMDSLLNALA